MPKVDKDICIGCGLCNGMHPEAFELDDEGKAALVEGAEAEAVEDAAANCPVGAISAE